MIGPLRWWILSALKRVYPHPVLLADITRIFYTTHTIDQITQACEFLAERGYLQRLDEPHPLDRNKRILMFRLTDRGMDILDETRKDASVPPEDV